ncbi:double zinc ribbon domain-containing protein [Kallotenue papyrolyticum]|uniref:double zinc ribbon domain-containing protein n=1 Tax=Kallotenue papyrolyticum TaxID=1325125 RepID=UPI0004786636|nr:zinc ribbon domain-containing protein [Kallotenue papyrolyticum]
MAITCPNGHINDAGNRFCDQCGAPLQATAAPAPAAEAPTGTSNGVICPVCGQENVPGTAFCDNCGAALPPPQPVAIPVPEAAAPVGASEQAGTLTCPQCGAVNDAANRFCDQCGAQLQPATSAPPAAEDQELVAAPEGAPLGPHGDLRDATALPSEGTAPPRAPEAAPAATPAAPEAEAAPTPAATTPEAQAAPTPAAGGDLQAERERLEQAIATQRQLVSQLEQLEQQFGAAMPAALRQGLDEARHKLQEAEAQLAALPSQPQADPEELRRLEEEVATQRQLVSQLEQLEQQFGAAMPAALRQGLDEARHKLQEAEARLNALGGVRHPLPSALDVAQQRAAASAAAEEPAAVSTPAPAEAPTVAAAPAGAASSAAPAAATVAAEAQPAPPPPAAPQPTPSGPRLVLRDGTAIAIPGGSEVIIGREDPISGIHPDIDLTPYGGEAGGVSRRHALLRQESGQWTITDLDSTNYTHVDGQRLAPNTPTALHDGARLRLGRIEMEFHTA